MTESRWMDLEKVDILHVMKWSACVCAAIGRLYYWLTVITLCVCVCERERERERDIPLIPDTSTQLMRKQSQTLLCIHIYLLSSLSFSLVHSSPFFYPPPSSFCLLVTHLPPTLASPVLSLHFLFSPVLLALPFTSLFALILSLLASF